MDGQRVRDLADLVQGQVPLAEWPAAWMRVEDQVRRSDVLLDAIPPARPGTAGSPGTRRAVHAGRTGQVSPARARRRRVLHRPQVGAVPRRTVGPWRHAWVVCNADEGEPGTFKDRVLLNRQADAVFEGMTLAARVLGARTGLLYLRGEYRFLLEQIEAVLARRRTHGLLGRSILGVEGFDFDIAIHVGAGAYVCGARRAP